MSAILVLMMFSPALGADEFLSRKNEVVASILQRGWADSSEQEMLLRYAKDCFSWNPVDTSSGVGGLQGSLGDATQCVLINLEQRWGWKPELTGSGSNNGGPYDAYGASNAVIGVDTPSGKWQFIFLKKSGGDDTTSHQTVSANCLHRGDATVEQETDLIGFTEQCFQKNPIDISNVWQFARIHWQCRRLCASKVWGEVGLEANFYRVGIQHWRPLWCIWPWRYDHGCRNQHRESGSLSSALSSKTSKCHCVLNLLNFDFCLVPTERTNPV